MFLEISCGANAPLPTFLRRHFLSIFFFIYSINFSEKFISNKNINLSLPSMSKMRTVVQPIIQKDTQVVTKTIVKKQLQPVPIFISSNRNISKLASMIS